MDELHQRRVARNESRFREANERIRVSLEQLHPELEVLTMMCECAKTECTDHIEIDHDRYRTIREHPARFGVKPEHVFASAEKVIDRFDDYWVVEKIQAARIVAQEQARDLPS